MANVRGRGLVVLTGCGHSGIVNILRYVRRLTGEDRLHAVIGGFHLSGPLFEPIIAPTCDALAALAPDYLVPSHCTGWRAIHAHGRPASRARSSRTASAPASSSAEPGVARPGRGGTAISFALRDGPTAMTDRDPALEPFDALIGTWATEATHPLVDAVVPGSITFEWLEGGHFIVQRSHNEHELFPDAISVIGAPEGGEGLVMEYFDSRGVRRTYGVSLDEGVLRIWRDAPGSTSATPPRSGATPSRACGSSPKRRATGTTT